MALDKRKMKAIECIINGENMSNVAKLAGVSRTALYNWMDDVEFKAELDRQTQVLKNQGEQRLSAKLNTYVDEIEKIALTGRSEKNRADCLQYLINRNLGMPTSKMANVSGNDDNKDKDAVDKNELQDELNKFRKIKQING